MKDTTYLVQRAKFRDNPMAKGLDSIIRLDYMGASEYEFGSLPKSLKAIRENIDRYIYFPWVLHGTNKTVTVFCHQNDQKEVVDRIELLADNKIHLKCWVDFGHWVHPENHHFGKNEHDFYWDIENNFMFWKQNAEFETKFKKVIL